LIQEGEGLIGTVSGVHDALVAEARQKAVSRIDGLVGILTQDAAKVGGDGILRTVCVQPLDNLKAQVQQEESVAHVVQAESEAVKAFDAAIKRIENHETHERHEKTPQRNQEAENRSTG
jgi:hypothetical protein